MFSEFTIGRRSGANAFGAYKILAPKSKWGIVGILAVLTPTLVVSFYSVVGGWTIDYMVKAAMSRFSMGSEGLGTLFSDTISSPVEPIIYMLVFLALSCLVVAAGVEKGIEKYTKIMMPALFIMIIVIAVRSVTLKGAGAGLSFLFNPDFSKVTGQTFLDALGQAFFSLSLGCGTIITYASYVAKKESIVGLSSQTAIADTTFALLAGVAIMPAVFSGNNHSCTRSHKMAGVPELSKHGAGIRTILWLPQNLIFIHYRIGGNNHASLLCCFLHSQSLFQSQKHHRIPHAYTRRQSFFDVCRLNQRIVTMSPHHFYPARR